ncbi:MAG: bifunctional DNA-formamidopyrimidine glycosylase/DNA-(apurinic or apyrimidinic site) lyase [Chloroflexi bacterium]|nr:bifunctional DNA-formamidopyrimidine glycosylase/DNA-(apurinic or apyrimidinic site) lyase [Chloroflexota bacterium]
MPELPEVETTVRDLRPRVVGRSFRQVDIQVPRMVRAPSPEGLRQELPGRLVQALERRGKYILFRLDRGALVVHLMMGGALMWAAPEGASGPAERARAKHTRLAFLLDDGSELWLVNPRTLGGVWLVESAEQVVGRLGPEPLSDEFTPLYFAARLKGRTSPIKPLLLSQEVVAGVGNIYADEALFLAEIRPQRPADELTPQEVRRLHSAVRAALERGIRHRGTSLGDFLDPFGGAGTHQNQLSVFRRQGQPCPRCGSVIVKEQFRGRGTHYCPSCQR